MFPGDIRVAGGSGSRWWATKSQDVSPQRGQPLCAELSVDEIQMCPHNQHCRVWCAGLEITHHTGNDGLESCAATSRCWTTDKKEERKHLKSLHQLNEQQFGSPGQYFDSILLSGQLVLLLLLSMSPWSHDNQLYHFARCEVKSKGWLQQISFLFPVTKFVLLYIWIFVRC